MGVCSFLQLIDAAVCALHNPLCPLQGCTHSLVAWNAICTVELPWTALPWTPGNCKTQTKQATSDAVGLQL